MQALQWFVGLGASVMLPVLLFIFALILRIKPSKALRSGLTVGIGFIGLNLVIQLLTTNLGPAAQAMVKNYHLSLSTIDVGWPAASAIAYGTLLGSLAIPVGVVVNVTALVLGLTKTLDVDVWNYWHIAFTGSLVYAIGHNFGLGILTMVVHALLLYLTADLSQPTVEKYYKLPNISFPHGSSGPGFFLAVPLNWVFDHIPGFNRLRLDPETAQKRLGVFGDTTVIGIVIGLIIGALAGFPVSKVLQLGMSMGAVMLLMPRMVALLMEGLTPISEGANELVQKRFPGRQLFIGMDSALAVGQSSVLSSSLILVPLSLLIAVILPGNHVLPFGDLATIPFIIALSAAVFRGDMVRTIIGGIIQIASALYIATWAAPLITSAAKAASFNLEGASSISVLSDGGVWTTWMIVGLGKLISWYGIGAIGVVVVCAMIYVNRIRKPKASQQDLLSETEV